MPSPIIFGFSGTELNDWERGFFRASNPAGYILFKRNCQTPQQVQALTDSLRELSGDADIPILIDQEGGRVMRLQPPHWPALSCMGWFGTLYDRAPQLAEESLTHAYQVIAEELLAVGINTVCAPCLDLPQPDADNIIGDRAFHTDPAIITHLGRIALQTFINSGLRPIIKHIPGHGRARVDSHLALPVVETDLKTLEATDFLPFRALGGNPSPSRERLANLNEAKLSLDFLGEGDAINSQTPSPSPSFSNFATLNKKNYPLPAGRGVASGEPLWAMLAHITYTALDNQVATYSAPTVLYIREQIGFTGTLLSDDLSMHALQGDFAERARRTLAAGVDLLLHCNGDPEEMAACMNAM